MPDPREEFEFNLQDHNDNRIGDHIWWISDISKFKKHYPEWQLTYSIDDILKDIYVKNAKFLNKEKG